MKPKTLDETLRECEFWGHLKFDIGLLTRISIHTAQNPNVKNRCFLERIVNHHQRN